MIRGVVAYPLVTLDGSTAGRLLLGPENALLRAALPAVAAEANLASDSPPPQGNLLVLCGAAGVGKSAVLDVLAQRWPADQRQCWTGADWARAYACAVDTDGHGEFRQRWRQAAVFVLDGLEQLQGKPAAQEELAQLLSWRTAAGRWSIFSCIENPLDHNVLSARVHGRLAAGLILPLQPPGPEARQQLLADLAAQLDLALSADVVDALLDPGHWPSGAALTAPQIRNLALQLKLFSEQHRQDVDAQVARSVAREGGLAQIPSMRRITQVVARYFNYRLADVRGPGRQRGVVRARSLSIYLTRRLTPETLAVIGQYFGGRDHTTVMHACKKVETQLQNDAELQVALGDLLRQLTNH